MDFNLDQDRSMLRDMLEKFLRDKYPIEKRLEFAASDESYSPQMWEQFAEMGIIGALFGEEVGGFGGAGDDIALVFEQLGRALVVEPFLSSGILAGTILAELKHEFVEEIISGKCQIALAHAEPDSRYDLTHVAARAERAGNDWVINGNKCVILGAPCANKFIVSARISGATNDEQGIGLFLVDALANGLQIRAYSTIDGYGAGDLILENTPATLLVEAGEAAGLIELAHARAVLAVCAECLGACEAAKDMTVEYMHTRKQFGVPIGKFQVLQHRMADVLIEIEQMRSAVINAAGHINDDRNTREKFISAAKNLIGRAGRAIAEEAIQIHGGIAMTWEAAISHYAKRIIMIDHLFGDTDHHLERYIALNPDLNLLIKKPKEFLHDKLNNAKP